MSRRPRKVNATDTLLAADLLDRQQTADAVKGSDIVYFMAGLPPNTTLWEQAFPVMVRNALAACRAHGAAFVYLDNTYMYPQDSRLLTEDTPFAPLGCKGKVRAAMAELVLDAIAQQHMPAVICRAPEFYGPGATQSITNALIIDRIRQHKRPRVPVRDDTLRSLIWTPDASRALALVGNTSDTYGQTWHLPCDDNRLTYQQFVAVACEVFGRAYSYAVLPSWLFRLLGMVSAQIRELAEGLPRYASDNQFDSTKFQHHFPAFRPTSYREGLERIRNELQPAVR